MYKRSFDKFEALHGFLFNYEKKQSEQLDTLFVYARSVLI